MQHEPVSIQKFAMDLDDLEGGEFTPLMVSNKSKDSAKLEHRASGIRRIHQDMLNVNQLFKDLSGIAVQQVCNLTQQTSDLSRVKQSTRSIRASLNQWRIAIRHFMKSRFLMTDEKQNGGL